MISKNISQFRNYILSFKTAYRFILVIKNRFINHFFDGLNSIIESWVSKDVRSLLPIITKILKKILLMEKVSIIYCRDDKVLIHVKSKDISSVLSIKTLKERIDNNQYDVINPETLEDYILNKLQMKYVRRMDT